MFALDVVIVHFFQRKYLITILTGVFKFDALSMNFHEMSPILKIIKDVCGIKFLVLPSQIIMSYLS